MMQNLRDKRSVHFGIGLGIVFAVAVMFVVYIIQRHSYVSEINTLKDNADVINSELAAALEGDGEADDDFVIARALELGMVFPPVDWQEPQAPPGSTTPPEGSAQAPPEGPETPEVPVDPPGSADAQAPVNPPRAPVAGHVWVNIEVDAPSITIARQLTQAGVVEDQAAFMEFLRENRLERRLMAGTFLLPLNGDYDAILERILAGRRDYLPGGDD